MDVLRDQSVLSNDRAVIVFVVWSLVLLGLLILREFLKSGRRDHSVRGLRILNLLVVVVIVVVIVTLTLGAVLRLASITVFSTPSPSPNATAPATSDFTLSPPSIPGPTSTAPPIAGSTELPTLTLQPTPIATVLPSPSLSPTPTLPTPTATPIPTLTFPTPTTTPIPTPTPTPEPTPSPGPTIGGTVTVGTRFTAYEVKDGQVTGFRERQIAESFTAPCTSPQDYPAPTLSNPLGRIRLVRILDGPYADIWVSPDDPEVTFKPRG
jgi:hypothetical protein